MSNFFRGWRRKTGFVLLLLSLEISAIWFRSYWLCDYFDTGKTVIFTHRGNICWEWQDITLGYFHYESFRLRSGTPVVAMVADAKTPLWQILLPLAYGSTFFLCTKTRQRSELK